MSHLVKPTSFRVGKTTPWSHNVINLAKSSIINDSLLATKGIERLSKSLLRRKRLYIVRAVANNAVYGQNRYRILYAPKIKTKPREHFIGAFIRRSIYKPFSFEAGKHIIKSYVNRRKEKIAKINRRYKPRKLNRWLTRRMFRGAANFKWKRKNVKMAKRLTIQRFLALCANSGASALLQNKIVAIRPTIKNSRKTLATHYGDTSWRHRWTADNIRSRRFNDKVFSCALGETLRKRLKIESMNLFSYLVLKHLMTYKSHQNHFWNFSYRRYRFQYKNYFDVANALLVMGLIDNSEGFLLSILRLTLPVILKIRRFFKFLNTVIKNMPEIADKFLVFRLHIAGKLAGGTKRTKSHSIGYGTLPVQTLNFGVTNAFLAYRHIYGEFGVKLVTCKLPTYKAPMMLA